MSYAEDVKRYGSFVPRPIVDLENGYQRHARRLAMRLEQFQCPLVDRDCR
jgi:hypothetical protein